MALDLNELKFCGLANTVAQEEFAASFANEEKDLPIRKSLYREYQEQGSPKDQRNWLRPKIATLFECLDARPKWIEVSPMWPFLNGQPMIFIGQMSVPANSVSNRKLAPESELYIFGARAPHAELPDRWFMEYRVVAQDQSLAHVGR